MEAFWKAGAVVILAVILGVAIGKVEKNLTVVLSITACCIVAMISVQYLSAVIAFLWELGNQDGWNNPFIGILLKIAGVAMMTEVLCLISSDAGNSALGMTMQFLGNAVCLFLALPIFDAFLSIIQRLICFL